MPVIPAPIPTRYTVDPLAPPVSVADPGSADILLGGHAFRLATSGDNPFQIAPVRQTAERIDQASEPGDRTLTDWQRKSQSSFHGGAGQMWLEPSVPDDTAKIRFDNSFNVDVWTPGQVTRLPDTTASTASGIAGGPGLRMATGYYGGNDRVVITDRAAGKLFLGTLTAGAMSIVQIATPPLDDFSPTSVTSDGANYYVAAAYTRSLDPVVGILRGSIGSTAYPSVIYEEPVDGPSSNNILVGWQKARLMAAYGRRVWELDANMVGGTNAFPATPNYTHPASGWVPTAFASSPTGILVSGYTSSMTCEIVQLSLDTSGSVPVLTGSDVALTMPSGELIYDMTTSTGSFLALATSRGVRVSSWNQYSANLEMGPLTLDDRVQYAVVARGDYIYTTASDLGVSGTEAGLYRIAPGQPVDSAGRFAYAPDIVTPDASNSAVTSVAVLPFSQRLVFVSGANLYLEGSGAGVGREAWIRTSRVRYSTVEPKLFKLGRVRGTVDEAQIDVAVVLPHLDTEDVTTLVTFTNVQGDPDEFRLPPQPREWMAFKITLSRSGCVLNSWQMSALYAPRTQWEYQFTCHLQREEESRNGRPARPTGSPRQRLADVMALKSTGEEVTFVQWDPSGPVAQQVTVESVVFTETTTPKKRDSFGGLVTFLLRTTEA